MDTVDINVPPFPRLLWDQYFWVGEVKLPSWAGFQTRRGPYGALSSNESSDGSARLTVTTEDSNTRTLPTPEQATAFRHLLDNESAVAAAVLGAIFAKYPEEKEAYLDAFDEDEVGLPDIREPGELRSMIGLSNVHILRVANKGAAYIGFEFGCVWGSEHGLGVMTH
jgi:hypothetical protein